MDQSLPALPSELMQSLISSLDLDDFQDVSTADYVVTHPKTGGPTDNIIVLASKDHPSRKKIDLARTRRLRQAFNQTGKMPMTDPIEDYDEETEYLVASTLGWKGLKRRGQEYPYSPENAKALYTDPAKQWLRAQVLGALNKSELFIISSVKS